MAGTTESKLEYLIRSKEDVRLAINRMLVPCPEDTPFLEYGPKIKQVDVDLSDATVTSDDLMEGVIAYDSKEQRLVGTIPDNGRLEYEPSDEEYIIPYGRTDGGKVNKADITKLAEYEACLRIANSVDNLDDYSDTTATAEDIRLGKTAYSNGELLEGNLEVDTVEYNIKLKITGTDSFKGLLQQLGGDFPYSGESAVEGEIDFAGITTASKLFYDCAFLKSIENLKFKNTQNLTNISNMFYDCSFITSTPDIDCGKVTSVYQLFMGCVRLEKLGLLINLGKAYTQKTENYNQYTVRIPNSGRITPENFIRFLDSLYDLNLSYDVANGGTLYRQQITMLIKDLTNIQATEEGLQALERVKSKGWDVIGQ